MIIFDLDGTLADCEHRRHFVDPQKNPQLLQLYCKPFDYINPKTFEIFKPDWDAFYEACDQDTPIQPVIEFWDTQISQGMMGCHQIWSGRSESVREKTEKWLDHHLLCFQPHQLKMRPIGDYTSDEQLKEKWLDERINDMGNQAVSDIKYIFDSHGRSIEMWRRRGIFVFNCNQSEPI